MILKVFLLFYIYSLAGWIWESTYESILNKRILNRGFLTGPYIPIYGFAGIFMLLVFQKYQTNVLFSIEVLKVYVYGLLVATLLEYITSYALERVLGARWWDYSDYPLNLNGRVCLIASLFWGFIMILFVNIVNPLLFKFIDILPRDIQLIYVSSMTTLFILDIIITINSIIDLRNKLQFIISIEKDKVIDKVKNLDSYTKQVYNLANPFTRRIIESFPKMKFKSDKLQCALNKLKQIRKKEK